jgi:hypothetical protein
MHTVLHYLNHPTDYERVVVIVNYTSSICITTSSLERKGIVRIGSTINNSYSTILNE